MTKHTPGPWEYRPNECRIVAPNSRVPWAEPESAEPVNVVMLRGSMGGEDTAADARLMAAAPELLECLKQLRFAMRHGNGLEAWHKIEDRADAAIAAAEGGE